MIDTQILNKILANWIQQYIKRIIHHETWSIGCIPASKDGSNALISVVHHINK